LSSQDKVVLYQCSNCLTVYNEQLGELENNIPPATAFNNLPEDYCCSLCDADKGNFRPIEQSELMLV
ncbi:MAG: hypothetical protein EOP55_19200, partial [Sphingobacteriales bacterium]